MQSGGSEKFLIILAIIQQSAVGGFTAHDAIMAAHGELMLLAFTAVGKGIAANGLQFKLMRASGRDAQYAFHHPFPLFAVRRNPAKMLPDQQMRQFMGHHFIAVPAAVPRC